MCNVISFRERIKHVVMQGCERGTFLVVSMWHYVISRCLHVTYFHIVICTCELMSYHVGHVVISHCILAICCHSIMFTCEMSIVYTCFEEYEQHLANQILVCPIHLYSNVKKWSCRHTKFIYGSIHIMFISV